MAMLDDERRGVASRTRFNVQLVDHLRDLHVYSKHNAAAILNANVCVRQTGLS